MTAYHYLISLRLHHPSHDPAQFTAALGLSPSRTWLAGAPRTRPDGVPLEGVNRESYWTARLVEGRWPDEELGEALSRVLDMLEGKASFLSEFNASGGEAEFFIGWFFDDGNSGDVLKPALFERLARLGIALSFDVYPPATPFVGDLVTSAWLDARGGLHDARALGASTHGQVILISIDDEWANQDDDRPVAPGALSLHHARIVSGNLANLTDAWISELRFDAAGRFIFDFCDRDPLVIQAEGVWWLSD